MEKLINKIDGCMLGDQFPLRSKLRTLQARLKSDKPSDKLQSELEQAIEKSQQLVEARRSALPVVTFPEDLPIAEKRELIAKTISENQVVVVAGETGSGKTTQLPKICLDLGRGVKGLIGHTQPRRLAARTIAGRIAEELNSTVGEAVGYKVRFTEQSNDKSYIKLMTDGILLAEIQNDCYLNSYDTIIIDEAHERSLNIDFLLGYLKQLLPKRPDLKLIITSATIDVERFAQHFASSCGEPAPVVEVSGRAFPVETRYWPLNDIAENGSLAEGIELAVRELIEYDGNKQGDILVFLSGEAEIREVSRHFRDIKLPHLDVLPLYARLSNAEQNRVFGLKSRHGRRLCLATNVAETSLTVPGIRYVIDPGEARISRYSHRTRLQRLPVEKVSQASANQRKGRCGRVAEGVCLRLYSEEDFNSRPEFTDPEILRTNLASVVLRMLHLGLANVNAFPFIEPPEPKMVRDGYKLLEELGAVSDRGCLTAIGKKMAHLPADPRLARMLLAADGLYVLSEMLVIVSALSIQDPREFPADKQTQANQAHARFNHPTSDFLSWISLWRYCEEQRQVLSQNQFRKGCKREFLSFIRLKEWRDVYSQLTISCRQLGLTPSVHLPEEENYQDIHKALLTGLLGQVAQQDEGRIFNAARNRKLQIFPGSAIYRKPPKWLVAGEIVETSQVFGRQCAAIEPEWLLTVNPHQLKRHYYQPSWSVRLGRVMALKKVTLYGLTISDGQRIHYCSINPAESRELMIREGLVAGQFKSPPKFLKKNLAMIREVHDMESRIRRRDLLVDEEVLFAFYDERLPAECVCASSLEKWLSEGLDAEQSLKLSREYILTRNPGGELQAQFPSTLVWSGVEYRLSYCFEPGKKNDGVSVTIPLLLLNRAPRYRFDWLVPGLLRDKCIALLKNLPKHLRKQLVPVPDVVDAALSELEPDDTDLCSALATVLKRHKGIHIVSSDWDLVRLEDFYRMNIRVVDDRGKLLAQGMDMAVLVAKFRSVDGLCLLANKTPTRDNVSDGEFGELPEEWKTRSAGMDVVAYPALVDHGDRIAIELFDYSADAVIAHRFGFAALAMHRSNQTVNYLRKQLLANSEASLALAGCGADRVVLVREVIIAALLAIFDGVDLPRGEQSFAVALERARGRWVPMAMDIERILLSFLKSVTAALNRLNSYKSEDFIDSRRDVGRQIEGLLGQGSVQNAPFSWLEQYPRYAKAIQHRCDRLNGQYGKDQKAIAMIAKPLEQFEHELAVYPGLLQLSSEARQFRWMLEEFRVSLFAQQLGTKIPVSVKRMDGQLRLVQQWILNHPR